MATRIAKPPDLYEILRNLDPETFVRLVNVGATLKDGRYLHWDDIRRREPPEGLTIEQWWAGMRVARNQSSRPRSLSVSGSGTLSAVGKLPGTSILTPIPCEANSTASAGSECGKCGLGHVIGRLPRSAKVPGVDPTTNTETAPRSIMVAPALGMATSHASSWSEACIPNSRS